MAEFKQIIDDALDILKFDGAVQDLSLIHILFNFFGGNIKPSPTQILSNGNQTVQLLDIQALNCLH